MILLDTDHITLMQWGGPPAERILQRLEVAGYPDEFPTTIITYEEQIRGWMARFSLAKTIDDEVKLYTKLKLQRNYSCTLRIFDFTEAAATEFQRLRSMRVRIGTSDLKIAAIALANNATLFTRNSVHFSKVPGLKFEDGSRP